MANVNTLNANGVNYPIEDETARTNAQTALNTANSAQTTAQDAQNTADSAQTAADNAVAAVSNLQTTVNELSNSLANLNGSYAGFTNINSIGDMNNIISPGWYIMSSSSTAKETDNTPFTIAFVLDVFNTINVNSLIQFAVPYNIGSSSTNKCVKARYYYNSTWGEWITFNAD